MYAHGGSGDKIVKIMIDDDHSDAVNSQLGRQLIEGYRSAGNHVLLISKDIVKFLAGHGRERPAKIDLSWIL